MADITDSTELKSHTHAPEWLPLVETLGLAMSFMVLGLLADRTDPFLLKRGFPWLAFAPLLAGLRHGSGKGVLAGTAMAAAAMLRPSVGLSPVMIESAFGWIAVGLLAGEFADAWRRKRRELEANASDLSSRLEALSRDHLALEASHEALKRQVPGEPVTLRDGLAAMGRSIGHRGPGALQALAEPILWLFAEHAFVQSGSFHLLDPEGRPDPAIAELGAGGSRRDDPLLLAAARSGEVTSVRERGDGSELLAAVPLVDVEEHVYAVVAIRDMPFLSLHDGTLSLLAVMGGYLGHAITAAASANESAERPKEKKGRWRRSRDKQPPPASRPAGVTAGSGLVPRTATAKEGSK
jgi:hypothetical protein